jgi:DNA repair photolyase
MIKEIEAKTLLSHSSKPDPWFGCSYTMNLYRGCQHQCIYCDSRSECYQIENFADILVKENAIERLEDELPRKRKKMTVCTGSMNDPYMPVEKERELTRRALEVVATYEFPVHVMTKSDLVLRDTELLIEIGKVYAAVSFTITTVDDDLGRKVEPGASLPSERLAAMKELSDAGVYTGVTMMPVLPFIEDTEKNIRESLAAFHEYGAQYVLPAFAVTLRDRQRDYYYHKLDGLFPGVKEKYEKQYGMAYECPSPEAKKLRRLTEALCHKYGILTKMEKYSPAQQRLL